MRRKPRSSFCQAGRRRSFRSAVVRSRRSRHERSHASIEKRRSMGRKMAYAAGRLTTTYPPFSTITSRLSMLVTRMADRIAKRRDRQPTIRQRWQRSVSAKATCTSPTVEKAWYALKLYRPDGRDQGEGVFGGAAVGEKNR